MPLLPAFKPSTAINQEASPLNCTKQDMSKKIDWTDVEAAAKEMAGNWRQFSCFAWSRGYDLDDADRWAIFLHVEP